MTRAGGILALAAALMLAACDNPHAQPQEQAASQTTAQAPAETAPAVDGNAGRYEMAGMASRADVEAFLNALKAANAAGDITPLIRFPFTRYEAGKVTATYADAAAFKQVYGQLVTPDVKSAIQNAKTDEVFINAQGAMIGAGKIWFTGRSGEKPAILILAINP